MVVATSPCSGSGTVVAGRTRLDDGRGVFVALAFLLEFPDFRGLVDPFRVDALYP